VTFRPECRPIPAQEVDRRIVCCWLIGSLRVPPTFELHFSQKQQTYRREYLAIVSIIGRCSNQLQEIATRVSRLAMSRVWVDSHIL